ncbi:putative lipid II flippase FtsW [Paenibacillus sp. PK4536]|uniref:Probable peptidoglycan glycosyltransferase FtsW n=2 Tax=Paenibacillus TaxID=44249 RepID=A0A1E3KZH3_9BACL|nr:MULTISPECIES: putative lipid II flippase FtsW [Paenibacillus]ODP26952.1 putative lipid II flippase FtsW [Paenibacillus nuruki]TKJ94181.1 putative lipid II flippase FtsW [Paenibacillus sp. CFBP13512]WIM38951.1 putative lipid II flippase FtsW [Paenibacillus sp. PK4536]
MNKIRHTSQRTLNNQTTANRYRNTNTQSSSNVRNIQQPAQTITKKGAPDFQLLIMTVILVCFGIIMVFSASSSIAWTNKNYNFDSLYFTKKHILYAVIGLVGMFFAMKAHYSKYKKWFAPFFLITLALLVIVLMVGKELNGARSWLNIFGFSLQPSEFAKLAVILYLAALISKKGDKLRDLRSGYIPVMVVVGLIAGLIFLQNDLGSCMILVATAGLIIFAGGASVKHIMASVLLLVLGASLVLGIGALFNHDDNSSNESSYKAGRIEAFLDPMADEKGSSYNLVQSLTAIGVGGFTGSGFGQSIQKLHYLPNPYNDFIFAVIGEEFGFIGTSLFLLLYGYFIWRGLFIALRCPDIFGTLVGVGIMSLIAIQAFINIGGVTNTIPITGVTLPFISYGGTSLIMMMTSMGIMLSISRETNRVASEKAQTTNSRISSRSSVSMRMK